MSKPGKAQDKAMAAYHKATGGQQDQTRQLTEQEARDLATEPVSKAMRDYIDGLGGRPPFMEGSE